MKLFIASDHAGFQLKEKIKESLKEYDFNDLGTNSSDSVDYPDYAIPLAEKVVQNDDAIGILICGTGIGMDIAANKVHGARAAMVYNENTAKLAREHDGANIICLGAREFSDEHNLNFIKIFLNSKPDGGRHARRVAKIENYENKNNLV